MLDGKHNNSREQRDQEWKSFYSPEELQTKWGLLVRLRNCTLQTMCKNISREAAQEPQPANQAYKTDATPKIGLDKSSAKQIRTH